MDDSTYSVEYLTDRAYETLSEYKCINSNNKLCINRPEVSRVNKKTLFTNFSKICLSLNRDRLDLQKFFEEELLTNTSVDSNGVLILNGNYKSSGIQKVLLSYLDTYVVCKECGCYDTNYAKESRILFLNCKKCLSKRALNK